MRERLNTGLDLVAFLVNPFFLLEDIKCTHTETKLLLDILYESFFLMHVVNDIFKNELYVNLIFNINEF